MNTCRAIDSFRGQPWGRKIPGFYIIGDRERNLVKPGFTVNMKKRMYYYQTHNPMSELYVWCGAGTMGLERQIIDDWTQHYQLAYGREWFYGTPDLWAKLESDRLWLLEGFWGIWGKL